jgi:hypothetical protein
MDSLATLVVEAIETVDKRKERREFGRRLIESLPPSQKGGDEAVLFAYVKATGTWTGCDWPTVFGPVGLNLMGVEVAEAETLALDSAGTPEGKWWAAAVAWLKLVEHHAQQAESEAALAVKAGNAGHWHEAIQHASKAWAFEFHTGRPIRRAATWEPLYKAVKAAAARARAEQACCS